MLKIKKSADEIDLHGLTVEEAVPLVDGFLHKSFKAGLFRVWVIHGKGSGALRSATRQFLSQHPLVRRCSTANGDRGGAGATQVDLAK
jgi:DNA mismatch repair protein MutS2